MTATPGPLTARLHVNPWRFRAWLPRDLVLGAVGGRTLPRSRLLESLHDNHATVDGAAVERAGLGWLRDERFLIPSPLALDHDFAPQLGFFSLWPGDPEDRLAALRRASVGLLGVGTLGSQVAHILAAAGVGHLVLCDRDVVEVRNLNRQLYDHGDLGRPKVEAAARRLRNLRPQIEVDQVLREVVTAGEIEDAVRGVDLVVRALDTPVLAPFEVDRAARRLGVPHVGGGFLESWGSAGPFLSPAGHCFRCLTAPPEIEVAEDRKVPTFAPLSFWLSAQVGGDVLRHLADLGEPLLLERTIMFDWATGQLREERLRPLPGVCPVCGRDDAAISGTAVPSSQTSGNGSVNDATARGTVPVGSRGDVSVSPVDVRGDGGGPGGAPPSPHRGRTIGPADRGGGPGGAGLEASDQPLTGAAAGLVGVCAVLAGIALMPAPALPRLGAGILGEIVAAMFGALVARPRSLVNGLLWGGSWAVGVTLVGAAGVVLTTPAIRARPVGGLAAILLAVPIDALLYSILGLATAWLAVRPWRRRRRRPGPRPTTRAGGVIDA